MSWTPRHADALPSGCGSVAVQGSRRPDANRLALRRGQAVGVRDLKRDDGRSAPARPAVDPPVGAKVQTGRQRPDCLPAVRRASARHGEARLVWVRDLGLRQTSREAERRRDHPPDRGVQELRESQAASGVEVDAVRLEPRVLRGGGCVPVEDRHLGMPGRRGCEHCIHRRELGTHLCAGSPRGCARRPRRGGRGIDFRWLARRSPVGRCSCTRPPRRPRLEPSARTTSTSVGGRSPSKGQLTPVRARHTATSKRTARPCSSSETASGCQETPVITESPMIDTDGGAAVGGVKRFRQRTRPARAAAQARGHRRKPPRSDPWNKRRSPL